MTLPEIAAELESLIQRLQTARTLLASLGPDVDLPLAAAAARTPRPTRERRAAPDAAKLRSAPQDAPAKPTAEPAPARPTRRGRISVPTSLAGKVPTGPVAVPAAEIRRRFSPTPAPAPAPSEPTQGNSLDDLLRELARRPLSSAAL